MTQPAFKGQWEKKKGNDTRGKYERNEPFKAERGKSNKGGGGSCDGNWGLELPSRSSSNKEEQQKRATRVFLARKKV